MSKRKKRAVAVITRQRNLAALNPLMGKNAVHGRSRKAERRRDRVILQTECDHQSVDESVCASVVTLLRSAA